MIHRPIRSLFGPLVLGVVVPTVLWAVFLVGLVLVAFDARRRLPNFADLNLPAGTRAAIAVADWVAVYWYILPLSLPFLLAPNVAVVLWLGRRPHRLLLWLWCGLMIALPLLAAVLAALALYAAGPP
jgi:hypothetical protein